ncbi:putative protein y4oD [Rhodovulum sp. PH10]|uniref:NYN domain-containing protein n=1 Tax=Rhodovulum sp. PH10 TaxID=1187851 RepID=UPI00027C1DEB|nr:NYN domain-containing protein [Rhodovulum sp. PH10]EJW12466.1 putative protein y4oD [Rhodovulum sp. PH10]
MKRVAVFVDAGYLFAQGSVALTGAGRPRASLALDGSAVVARLAETAGQKAGGCELLRIYWYDGASFRGPTIEQELLAGLDDVKLRLGMLNSAGEQKGVDSLIVTDLIELARLGAICDAVLLSGDEDVRVGVQIAQNYGVRVHLLGIAPARGSQSKALRQEADTTAEWDEAVVSTFLSVRSSLDSAVDTVVTSAAARSDVVDPSTEPRAIIEAVAQSLAAALDGAEVAGIVSFWTTARGVPAELDGKLLASCRTALGRVLTRPECRLARDRFSAAVRGRHGNP